MIAKNIIEQKIEKNKYLIFGNSTLLNKGHSKTTGAAKTKNDSRFKAATKNKGIKSQSLFRCSTINKSKDNKNSNESGNPKKYIFIV